MVPFLSRVVGACGVDVTVVEAIDSLTWSLLQQKWSVHECTYVLTKWIMTVMSMQNLGVCLLCMKEGTDAHVCATRFCVNRKKA